MTLLTSGGWFYRVTAVVRRAGWARSMAGVAGVAAFLMLAAPGAAADRSVEPQKLSTPPVTYPEGGRGDAEVLLDLDIAEDGTVTTARLRRGRNPFARAAREAVLGWRFSPARRNGVPTRGRVSTIISFQDPLPVIPALDPAALAQASDASLSSDAEALEGLEADEGEAEEVIVQAERRSEIGGTYIPREEARQIPGTFADPFRVVEVLPGIAPIVSGLPYFFVRGAPPGNVGYFIDGIRVPLLFHVGAGPSVMAPGLIERVDVVPSGYSARFGRAAGGIIVGETTASSGAARGEFQARTFDMSGLIEVPVSSSGLSLLAGGRYSYVQPLLDQVAPDYALGYWDYQARAYYQASPRDVVALFGFGASDTLESRPLDRKLMDTEFHRLDLRWDHVGTEGSTRVALTGSIDRAQNGEDDVELYESELRSRGLRLRVSADQKLTRYVTLRVGGDGGLDEISREVLRVGDRVESYPERTDLSGSLYMDTILDGPGVEVVPGLRLEAARWRGARSVFLEPRLGSKLRLWNSLSWVSQLGITHQFPTQSVRIPGQQADPIESSIQTAYQAAEGLEFGRSSILLGKLMAFHSWIDTADRSLHGRSYGLETFFRREFAEGVGGILSYTLSRTRTTIGRETVPSEFDRTHVISAVLGWYLGAGFRLGLRGYFASGQNYAVACPTPECGPGDPEAPRLYTQRGRLPNFYRADLRFEKRWDVGMTGWVAIALEWFNATLSKETTAIVWSPDTGTLEYVERDPLTLPSLGIEGGF